MLSVIFFAALITVITASISPQTTKFLTNVQNTSSTTGWPVLVLNSASNSIESIDSSTNTQIGTSTLSGAANDIVASADGVCYATSNVNDTVTFSYYASQTSTTSPCKNVVGTNFNTTGEPVDLAISPNLSYVYATISNSPAIDTIDTSTKAVSSASISGPASGIAYDQGNGDILVSIPTQHSVVFLSSTGTVVETIALPSSSNPSQVLVGPNFNHAYVMDSTNDIIYKLNLNDYTYSTIAYLNFASNPTPINYASAMAINPAGTTIYYTNSSTNAVYAVFTNGIVSPFTVNLASGSSPTGIQITPNGQNLFVTLSASNSVADINITATPTPTVTTISSSGTTPTALSIIPDQAPVGTISSTGTDTVDSTVSFYAAGSYSQFGSITSYAWNFGDGNSEITTTPTINHTYTRTGTYSASVTVTNSNGTSTKLIYNGTSVLQNGSNVAIATETVYITGMYYPTAPTRICDTRWGTSGLANQCNSNGTKDSPLGPQSFVNINVVNVNNDGVPSYATAVIANVTAVSSSASPAGGYLTIWPTGTPMPNESTQNFIGGQIVPHQVQVQLGQNGQISVYNYNGSTELIVDVLGWIGPNTNNLGNSYFAIQPYRICDTRPVNGTIVVKNQCDTGTNTTLSPNSSESLNIQVTGMDSIPTNATAAVVNITATNTTQQSFITAWGSGTEPNTSILNWTQGNQTVANEVTVPLSSSGTFTVQNFAGATDIIVDINGYYLDTAGSSTLGSSFVGINPTRICDTRSGSNISCAAQSLNSNSILTVQTGGLAGIPMPNTDSGAPLYDTAVAAVANVTVTNNSQASFLTAWQGGGVTQPNSSNINWSTASTTVSNTVIVPLNSTGSFNIYNFAGTTDVVVDIMGFYVNNPGVNVGTMDMLNSAVSAAATTYAAEGSQFQAAPTGLFASSLQSINPTTIYIQYNISSTDPNAIAEVSMNICGGGYVTDCQWVVFTAWAPQTYTCYYVIINNGSSIPTSNIGTISGPAIVNNLIPAGVIYATTNPTLNYLYCQLSLLDVTNATAGSWPVS